MADIVNCPECKTELIIEEDIYFFETVMQLEKAACPCCRTNVMQKEISGWLFVSIHTPLRKPDEVCTFPMS